jgi:ATP-binding cassette, subfamily B, bacterial PglK
VSLPGELWSVLTGSQRRAVIAVQFLSLLMALATVSGVASIAPFFAVLGDPTLIERNLWLKRLYEAGGFASMHSFMLVLGAGFVMVVLAANLVCVLGHVAMNRLALSIGNELQTTLFAQYLSRPFTFHSTTHSTTLLNKVLYETTRITHGVLENCFTVVTNLATAALIVISMLFIRTAAALALIGLLAAGYGLIYLRVRGRLLALGTQQSHLGAEQARIVTESFGAIREISVLPTQELFRTRFERASREYLCAAGHMQLLGQSPRHLMECIAAAGLVALALALGSGARGLGPWLGSLTFLAFACYRMLPTLQQVFAAIVRIRADRAALASVGPDLRQARLAPRTARASPADSAAWSGRPREHIRVRELSFRYANDRPWALEGVTLAIPAHAIVGIVGSNGAGKSTLLDVLAGLLTPEHGCIEIDGCRLNEHNRSDWQSRIACVPQELFLLDASLEENIALGVPAEAIDIRRLRHAARLAQLEKLIASLPQGLRQPLGERGCVISGGERQRIGIARALYREASVLLLDEATGSLDGLTEQQLMATLAGLRGSHTVVLIAHRMSSVRDCDIIFELDRGHLVGSGTYESLLASSGRFRQLAGRG